MNPVDDSRDRLIALEVKVQHLSDQLEDTNEKLTAVHDIMLRGQGAWWVVVGASGFVGFLLSLAVKLFPWAATLPK